MCGIIGIYDPFGRLDERMLQRMTTEITHRGPDGGGHYLKGNVGLGARRLSIIDLEGGDQPIANEQNNCWIVFNGEIYNYQELGAELRQKGHQFRSLSDTETIIHQYEDFGRGCLQKLNGMYAFAIWDESKKELFLARDRLGIKPLYYFWDGQTLIFASEIKAIFSSGLASKKVNPEALWHYLTFRYIPQPLTIWQNIHKIPPGHFLSLCTLEGAINLEQYWEITYDDTPSLNDEQDSNEGFAELFLDAVQKRLISDVPVGILLSGGLDSSAIAAAVAEVHNTTLSTFSVAFEEGEKFSELEYARQIAAQFGTDHHEIVINQQDFFDYLPSFVWHSDEPLADPASIPLYYVAKLASEHVKVVLSGEGADEVLAGYDLNKAAQNWDCLALFQRLPTWIRKTLPKAIFQAIGYKKGVMRLEHLNLSISDRNRHLLPHMVNYFSNREKHNLWPKGPSEVDSDDIIRGYYSRAQTIDPLHQILYAYCQDWLVEDLLMKADKMTMANSLELRVPFLDHRLVEWLATQPSTSKVKHSSQSGYSTKHLLRQFAAKRLPTVILQRPKLGFPVPLTKWFHGPRALFATETLLSPDSKVNDWFQREVLKNIVIRGTNSNNPKDVQQLWLLLVLEFWAREWL